MVVCFDNNRIPALVIRRTNIKTKYIMGLKKRDIHIDSNKVFDARFTPSDYNPGQLAEMWVKSTIKIAEKARKELEMAIALSKRKIVAKLEEGAEGPSNTVEIINGMEDLEGKEVKELLRLLNMTKTKEEKVKSFTEGDDPVAVVWAAMEEYEVPPKKDPKRNLVPTSVRDNTTFTAIQNEGAHKESTRTVVYNALEAIGGSGTAEEIAAEAKMDVKTVKGYLRPLVATGKVEAFTPEPEPEAEATE